MPNISDSGSIDTGSAVAYRLCSSALRDTRTTSLFAPSSWRTPCSLRNCNKHYCSEANTIECIITRYIAKHESYIEGFTWELVILESTIQRNTKPPICWIYPLGYRHIYRGGIALERSENVCTCSKCEKDVKCFALVQTTWLCTGRQRLLQSASYTNDATAECTWRYQNGSERVHTVLTTAKDSRRCPNGADRFWAAMSAPILLIIFVPLL